MAGKLNPITAIQRHARVGRQDVRIRPNVNSNPMYGHRVELFKSTKADASPNARPAIHVGRSVNKVRIDSLAVIDIPPATQVRRSRAFVISRCSATRAFPQARRSEGSNASIKRFRHLATALARNCTLSLISTPLGACLRRRCFQCSASCRRADRCQSIEMAWRTARPS